MHARVRDDGGVAGVEVDGQVELTFRIRVPVAEAGRIVPLLTEIGALHGAEVTQAAAGAVPPPQLAQPVKARRRPLRCPVCHHGYQHRKHKEHAAAAQPAPAPVPAPAPGPAAADASAEEPPSGAHETCPPHHWVIAALNGTDEVPGTCRKCGAVKPDFDPHGDRTAREYGRAGLPREERKAPAPQCSKCGRHPRSAVHQRDCMGITV